MSENNLLTFANRSENGLAPTIVIAFFRGNFSSRFVGLLIFYFLLRVPLLVFGVPLTHSDLHNVLLGERLAEGLVLYRDLYDPIAPLSAVVFWLLHILFGRAPGIYALLGSLLILLQALRLNLLFNRNKVHTEKSFLPALAYALCGSLFFEFDRVSPVLLGLSFLIFSLGYLTTFSKEGNNDRKLFKGGLMLGLAALCYLPLGWFLLIGLGAILFFASDAVRSFLLLLVGFVFPYAVACTVFLYNGSLQQFAEFHLGWGALMVQQPALPWQELLWLLTPMLILVLLGWLRLYSESASLNYRVRFQQLMILWLLVSVPVVISAEPITVRPFVVLLPAVAYFGVLAWSVRKPVWLAEAIFGLVTAGVVFSRFGTAMGILGMFPVQTGNIVAEQNPYSGLTDKDVLVLGDQMEVFLQNRHVTPFLYWPIAKTDFTQPFTYEGLFRIDKTLSLAPPDVIVDQHNLMPALQYHLPQLSRYKPGRWPNVYEQK